MDCQRHSFPELPTGLFRKKTFHKVQSPEPHRDPSTPSPYINPSASGALKSADPDPADANPADANPADANSATHVVTSNPRRCERSFSLPLNSLVSEKYLPHKDSQVSVPPTLQSIREAQIEASPLTPCTPVVEFRFHQIYNNRATSLSTDKTTMGFKAPKKERHESLYHILESQKGSKRSEPLYEPVPDSAQPNTGHQRVKSVNNLEKGSSEAQNCSLPLTEELPPTDCGSGRVSDAGFGYRMSDGHEKQLTQTIGGGRGSKKIVVFRRAVSYSGSRHADLKDRKHLLDKRCIGKTMSDPNSNITWAHSISSLNGTIQKNSKILKQLSQPASSGISSEASTELRKPQYVENINDELESVAIHRSHQSQPTLYRQNALEEICFHNSVKTTKPSMGRRIVRIRMARRTSDIPSPAREETKTLASALQLNNQQLDSYRSNNEAALLVTRLQSNQRLSNNRPSHKTRMWSGNDSPTSLSVKNSPHKFKPTSINGVITQTQINTSSRTGNTTTKLLRGNSFLESFADDEQTDHSDDENSNAADTDSSRDVYEVIPAITQQVKTNILITPKNIAGPRHGAWTSNNRRVSCPTLLRTHAHLQRCSSKPDPTINSNSNKPFLKNKLCAVTSSSVLHPVLAPRRSTGNMLSKDWLSTNDLITKSGSVSTFGRIVKALSGSLKSLRRGKLKREGGERVGKSVDASFTHGGNE